MGFLRYALWLARRVAGPAGWPPPLTPPTPPLVDPPTWRRQAFTLALPNGETTATLYQPRQDTATPAWVILLHGGGTDQTAAWPWANALLAEGIGALTVDLDGHGSNTRFYTTPGMAGDVVLAALELLRAQGLAGRVGLLGASLGGVVALKTMERLKQPLKQPLTPSLSHSGERGPEPALPSSPTLLETRGPEPVSPSSSSTLPTMGGPVPVSPSSSPSALPTIRGPEPAPPSSPTLSETRGPEPVSPSSSPSALPTIRGPEPVSPSSSPSALPKMGGPEPVSPSSSTLLETRGSETAPPSSPPTLLETRGSEPVSPSSSPLSPQWERGPGGEGPIHALALLATPHAATLGQLLTPSLLRAIWEGQALPSRAVRRLTPRGRWALLQDNLASEGLLKVVATLSGCPLLLVYGVHDPYAPLGQGRALQRAHGHADLWPVQASHARTLYDAGSLQQVARWFKNYLESPRASHVMGCEP